MLAFPLPRHLPLLAALVLALPAAPALAAPGPALAWPGAEIRAGQTVELSWSELPAGVEEMEILLSLDDGRHYSIRVSPELDAHERRYLWRVPNLPAARARLRMRLGTTSAEIETGPTSPFRIAGASEASPTQPLFHEGTFWTGLEPPGTGVTDPDVLSPVNHLDAASPGTAVAAAPPRTPHPVATLSSPAPDHVAADDSAPPCPAPHPTRPPFSPLRI